MARLSSGDRHVDGLRSVLRLASVVSLDSSPDSELDEIKREEPDEVPDPGDSDPSTRDTLDVGETPVSVGGDD